ncbi:hypothetical protein OF83DRAFT_1151190 [Amylostereum chailletii]|nr:hypothetical protein OF83DRAFT_1151190 [Amylostereum chailletii]
MGCFTDLPIELLPLIIQHVVPKSSYLANLCLVNRIFHTFTIGSLYERIVIYPWHKQAKAKIVDLFRTLAENPHLAQQVSRLEIRDFPRVLSSYEAYEDLERSCIRGIANSTNLRSCTWTRDGTLNTDILKALQTCPNLAELELNGNHQGNYDPRTLASFSHLEKITLIMPSSPVLNILPQWIAATGPRLRTLTLICKATPLVNDALLGNLSPHLRRIERLSLAGCPKVTHEGVWAVIRHNVGGIRGLGLEGLTPHFDIVALSGECARAGFLTSLESFTLTIRPDLLTDAWIDGASRLLSHSPLEAFQLYATDTTSKSYSADALCARIVAAHGPRLARFAFNRLRLTPAAITEVCVRCTELQQLFMLVDPSDLPSLGPVLARATALRTVHVNLTHRPKAYHPRDQAHALLSHCSPTVTQLGIETRVWHVDRIIEEQDGKMVARRVLAAYESPDIPEQFLVVRA